MTFARWYILLLLVVPVLLGVWEWLRRGHPLVVPFDHGNVRRGRVLGRVVAIANLLPALLLAAATVVLAGPQRSHTADKQRELANILFCLDVSGSMQSPFGGGGGSCYDGAMEAIHQFTTYRPGDAFGLTIFGNEVLHWVPVTKDLSAIRMATPFLRPEKMPHYFGGTQIGKALRECQKVLASRPEGDRMIILVSDGLSADLGPQQAQEIASELRADKIAVYTVIVSNEAAPEDIYTIASTTGGEVFNAGDPAALKQVFQHIDKMQSARFKPAGRQFADFFAPVALAGLSLCALHLLTLFGLRYTPW